MTDGILFTKNLLYKMNRLSILVGLRSLLLQSTAHLATLLCAFIQMLKSQQEITQNNQVLHSNICIYKILNAGLLVMVYVYMLILLHCFRMRVGNGLPCLCLVHPVGGSNEPDIWMQSLK